MKINHNKCHYHFLPTLEFCILQFTQVISSMHSFKDLGFIFLFSKNNAQTCENFTLLILGDFLHIFISLLFLNLLQSSCQIYARSLVLLGFQLFEYLLFFLAWLEVFRDHSYAQCL